MHSNVSQDGSASLGFFSRHIYLLVDLKDDDDLIENSGKTFAFMGAN
jgi:hypothetical protein